MEKLLEEGERLSISDVVKELAAQWKHLSEEERAEWNAKAAVVKESMVVPRAETKALAVAENEDRLVKLLANKFGFDATEASAFLAARRAEVRVVE